MKSKILVLGCFLVFSSFVFSQELPDVVMVGETDHKHLKETNDNYFLNAIRRMEITYTPSQKFVDTDYERLCLPTSKLFTCFSEGHWSLGCSYPFLTSKDNEIMIFTNFCIASKEEQKERMELILKDNLKYLGKNNENWENFVSFYSPKKAKKRFNIDTAFRYTIPLFTEDVINRNGKEYKYAEKFFIWNKEIGFIDLTCFYTDNAKSNFQKYWKDIEKMFQYQKK